MVVFLACSCVLGATLLGLGGWPMCLHCTGCSSQRLSKNVVKRALQLPLVQSIAAWLRVPCLLHAACIHCIILSLGLARIRRSWAAPALM